MGRSNKYHIIPQIGKNKDKNENGNEHENKDEHIATECKTACVKYYFRLNTHPLTLIKQQQRE